MREDRAKAEGRAEGIQQGRSEGLAKRAQLKMAQQMLAAVEPIEKIKQYTGLSEAEIKDQT